MGEQQERRGDAVERPDPETPAVQATAQKADLQSGEKVFTIVLFLIGLFFFWQSLQLWSQVGEPKLSSAAALPLFVSGVWTLLSFLELIGNVKKSTPLSGAAGGGEKVKAGLLYAVPVQVLIVLGAVVVYCGSMMLGLSFYIATPVFLYGTICFLTRKNYLLNILWTAICMGFIFVVFRLLFKVVFP